MGPGGRSLDQRHAELVVDLAQTANAQAGPELMEHAHIGNPLPMGQARKGTPSPLLGQQRQDLVEGVCRCQHRQQMGPPQLGCAEVWPWSALRTRIPMLVDKSIGNEW